MLTIKARGRRLYVWGKLRGQEVRKSTGLVVGQEVEAESLLQAEIARIEQGLPDSGSLLATEGAGGPGESPAPAVAASAGGDWKRVGEWTVSDAIDVYLEDPAFVRGRGTVDYMERVRRLVGGWKLARMDEDGVEDYEKRRFPGGTSVNNLARERRALRALLNYVGERSRGQYRAPKFRVEEQDNLREVHLTEQEIDAALDVIWREYKYLMPVYTTFFYQGARPIELCRLEWERDVRLVDDLNDCHLVFRSRKGKGGKWRTRTNPMHARVKAVLETVPVEERTGAVFKNMWGQPWSLRRSPAWLSYWRDIAEKAGVRPEARAYDIRHTYATRLKAGLQATGRLLGHASLKTTMRYKHIVDDELRELAQRV